MSAVSLEAPRGDRFALPALVLGSIFIGASPIFVRLSELGPLATAFHRVFWALPPLYIWMRLARGGRYSCWRQQRRRNGRWQGRRSNRRVSGRCALLR